MEGVILYTNIGLWLEGRRSEAMWRLLGSKHAILLYCIYGHASYIYVKYLIQPCLGWPLRQK